jgi:hypothetical protein
MAVDLNSIVFYTPPSKAALLSNNHQPSHDAHIPLAISSCWTSPQGALYSEQETSNINHGANHSFTTPTPSERGLLHTQDQESSNILDFHEGKPWIPLTMALANGVSRITKQRSRLRKLRRHGHIFCHSRRTNRLGTKAP